MGEFGLLTSAEKIEKQMKRYIKMLTTVNNMTYQDLKRKGFKIEVVKESGFAKLVVIHRK